MKMFVGLGNPGERYDLTRHNLGFWVTQLLDTENELSLSKNSFNSIITEIDINGKKAKLVQPQTYMNNSGEAVVKIKNFYKIDNQDICVIHDDVDLPMGNVKISLGGSSAGHKGVQSIIDQLGTDQFWRVRIGVGRSDKIPTEDWVLMKYTDIEHSNFLKVVSGTAEYLNTNDLAQTTLSIDINS
jgi:PTH1 family peptidyl-tRNA hydrolase